MMKMRVIRTEQENNSWPARIEELMEMEPTPEVVDEIELPAILGGLYEEKKGPIPFVDPSDAIRFRMEQQGLNPKDLMPYIGCKSNVSEVLSGKRSLSLSLIRKLHEGLGISLDVLLGQEDAVPGKIAEQPTNYQPGGNDR